MSSCNSFCCCGNRRTSMKLLALSLFYFLTQHLHKTGTLLKHVEHGRDWHYLFYTQSWSLKLMPNLPQNPGSTFGWDTTVNVICWCNEDISWTPQQFQHPPMNPCGNVNAWRLLLKCSHMLHIVSSTGPHQYLIWKMCRILLN